MAVGMGERSPRHPRTGPVATHCQPAEEGDPALVQQLSPVLFGEVANVGHEGRHQQHISTHGLLLLPQHLH